MADALLKNDDGTMSFQQAPPPQDNPLKPNTFNMTPTAKSPDPNMGADALKGVDPEFTAEETAAAQAGAIARQEENVLLQKPAPRLGKPLATGTASTNTGGWGEEVDVPLQSESIDPEASNAPLDPNAWMEAFGFTPEQVTALFVTNENGQLVPNIPDIATNVWLEKLGPVIAEKIESYGNLMNTYAVKGANELATNWAAGWKNLNETASSLGIGSDGMGLLMMTQGNAALLDAISAGNLDLMIKQGELDTNMMGWAFDLIKYGQDAVDAENNIRNSYWTAALTGLRDFMGISESAWEFAQQHGLDKQQLNMMQNEIDANLGLGMLNAILKGAADGLIPPEAFDNIMTMAMDGKWENVFQSLSDYGIEPPDGAYETQEDAQIAADLYDLGGYMYNVVENEDGTWSVDLIMQTIVGPDGVERTGFAQSENNEGLNALLSVANSQGFQIVSEIDPDSGDITYSIGTTPIVEGETMVLGPNGEVTYQADNTGNNTTTDEGATPEGDPKTIPGKDGTYTGTGTMVGAWEMLVDDATGENVFYNRHVENNQVIDDVYNLQEILNAMGPGGWANTDPGYSNLLALIEAGGYMGDVGTLPEKADAGVSDPVVPIIDDNTSYTPNDIQTGIQTHLTTRNPGTTYLNSSTNSYSFGNNEFATNISLPGGNIKFGEIQTAPLPGGYSTDFYEIKRGSIVEGIYYATNPDGSNPGVPVFFPTEHPEGLTTNDPDPDDPTSDPNYGKYTADGYPMWN